MLASASGRRVKTMPLLFTFPLVAGTAFPAMWQWLDYEMWTVGRKSLAAVFHERLQIPCFHFPHPLEFHPATPQGYRW